MTPEQEQRKLDIARLKLALERAQSQCAELGHVIDPGEKSVAHCHVCGLSLGWKCEKSPDGVCHVLSEAHDLSSPYYYQFSLINGKEHVASRDTLEGTALSDCIFCGTNLWEHDTD